MTEISGDEQIMTDSECPDVSPSPLGGLRVIEVSSFVAAPSAGLVLAQLGADVIRVDPLGGAADIDRWPVTADGASLFWAGLNRGKRSVALDLSSPEGREILQGLVTATGDGGGILVSNLSGKAWLSDEVLRRRRADLIHVQVLGLQDGSAAVDYTVSASAGVPGFTGPADHAGPVNSVLPTWDLCCGLHTAIAVLAGIRRRDQTGAGTHATVSLEEVAFTTLTSLGFLSEVLHTGADRARYGNYLFGSFGVDMRLADGTDVMVVALTKRQWASLIQVTGLTGVMGALAQHLKADFDRNADRFRHREVLTSLMRPWFAAKTMTELTRLFSGTGVLWSPYRRLSETVAELAAGRLPSISARADEGIGRNIATLGPISMGDRPATAPPAPTLGAHTDQVLAELFGAVPASPGLQA
jgi:2-methylfumaryl-CoA isomerase